MRKQDRNSVADISGVGGVLEFNPQTEREEKRVLKDKKLRRRPPQGSRDLDRCRDANRRRALARQVVDPRATDGVRERDTPLLYLSYRARVIQHRHISSRVCLYANAPAPAAPDAPA